MKIKIEREEKKLLTLGTVTFRVNGFYYYKNPHLPDHMYQLRKISQNLGDQWMLHFDEDQSYVADVDSFEAVPENNLKKCNCNFLCSGWIYK